jgi:hypothetical protein
MFAQKMESSSQFPVSERRLNDRCSCEIKSGRRSSARTSHKQFNTGKFMFGPIIVFAVAVALVAAYMFTANRFLRSDEHWNEPSQMKPVTKALAPAYQLATTVSPRRDGLSLRPELS